MRGMQNPNQSPDIKVISSLLPSREESGFDAASPEQLKGLSVQHSSRYLRHGEVGSQLRHVLPLATGWLLPTSCPACMGALSLATAVSVVPVQAVRDPPVPPTTLSCAGKDTACPAAEEL